jgi:hypothetical protein
VADTGIPFSYLLVLFQDTLGGLPDARVAADYSAAADEPSYPILADLTASVLEATPYEGHALPGKCILGPDLVLLDCRSGGDEDDWAFELIEAHAAAHE